jgi:hypothetical protein
VVDTNQNQLSQSTPLTINITTEAKELIQTQESNSEVYPLSVSEVYLNNLPRIKKNAYLRSKALWDSGITSNMIDGSHQYEDELRDILIELAQMTYDESYFNGKPIKSYYEDLIQTTMNSSQKAMPTSGGTTDLVVAYGDYPTVIDELIIDIIQKTTEPAYFQQWKTEWDNASVGL